MVMEEGTSDDDGTCTSSDDEMERIVLHVYDDESKEFSSLTTYHGMVKIRSRTEFVSAFDAVLLGESLNARRIMDLHRLEDVFMNITRTKFDIRRFLEDS
ncbi:hypothetical protein GCK32_022320, partial [Trichostrongylus colubriformis]